MGAAGEDADQSHETCGPVEVSAEATPLGNVSLIA